MSSTTVCLLVAALLLTGLAATPGDAHPVRYRGRGWWRRYSPPATPTATPPPSPPAHQQCTCAPPSPPVGTGGGSGGARPEADVPDPLDCVTPMAGMMTCYQFLTGSSGSEDAPAPGSECCAGLAGFVDSATMAGGGGDSQLKCLCPVIRGEVNEFLPKPMDPLRMIFLPSACAVAVPPQVIPLCLNASSLFVTTMTP